MYELKQGTERLVNAICNIKDDLRNIEKLAVILNYIPEQLKEDIQALDDFIKSSTSANIH